MFLMFLCCSYGRYIGPCNLWVLFDLSDMKHPTAFMLVKTPVEKNGILALKAMLASLFIAFGMGACREQTSHRPGRHRGWIAQLPRPLSLVLQVPNPTML